MRERPVTAADTDERDATTDDAGAVERAPLTSSRRWIIGIAVAFAVLCAIYVAAVLTTAGQAHENAALRGADQVSPRRVVSADAVLGGITVGSLAVMTLVVGLIGLARRRVDLAVAGVGVIVAGQVVTQSLKRFILPRPDLVEASPLYVHNTLPSGHTTIAMTVLFALILVIPYRWRGITLLFALPWAMSIGAYTVMAKWHRVSDTIAADAVSFLLACAASWWLTRRIAVVHHPDGVYHGRQILFGIVAAFVAVVTALGVLLWLIPVFRGTDFRVADPTSDYTAYLGGHAMAASCSGIAALAFWALWHRLDAAKSDHLDWDLLESDRQDDHPAPVAGTATAPE